jgi:ABC-type glycerol-3-phosphate transport system substrate-binding protein
MWFLACSERKKEIPGPVGAQNSEELVPVLPDGPVSLNIMGGAHLITTTEAALKPYLVEHKNVTINFEKYSYAEYPVKMRLQFASGDTTPDVVLVHDIFIPQFVKSGWLMDLTGMIPTVDVLPMLGIASINDRHYGLPNQATNVYVFMYLQDVYDRLGLQAPSTWDEYFQQALILKQHGYYAGALAPDDATGTFLSYMGMLGGSVFDKDGNVSFAKGVEAVKMIKQALDAGIFHKSNQADSVDYWTAFNTGTIAAFPGIAFQAARYLSSVDSEGPAYGKIRLSPPIRFSTDGPENFSLNTEYFAINAKTRNRQAAMHLVAWLALSEEGCQSFANVDNEGINATYTTAYLPGIHKVIENGTRPWELFGGQQVIADVARILVDTMPSIPYKDSRTPEAESIINEVLGEMFINNTYTPEQAIDEMRSRISTLEK